MARKIEVDLTSDTSDFEKGMDGAAKAVDRLDKKLDDAAHGSKSFDDGLGKVSDGLDGATGKFRSTADLAGGLGDVLGIQAAGPIAGYAMGFADIADGLGGLLAPALTKAKAAFMAMNATLLANPIFLVIAALTALTVGFVIAYKKSETFRNIVNGAMDSVKNGVSSFVDFTVDAVKHAAKVLAKIADIITTPYQLAFRAIAALWNNTIGRLSFSIPGWVPGIGGNGFDVPDIPMLAKGGRLGAGQAAIVGERGPELFVPGASGAVVPNGQFGGGNVMVVKVAPGAGQELLKLLRFELRTSGGTL